MDMVLYFTYLLIFIYLLAQFTGGKEVAKFTQDHFIQEFTSNKYFQAKDFQNALKYTFHRIDELLEDAKTGIIHLLTHSSLPLSSTP
jgi:hypothetical protein